MSAPTYRIETLADVLKVPPERRATMFRELERGLLLHELASSMSEDCGMGPIPLVEMTWTDDGCGDATVYASSDGKALLSLRIKKT